jgi:outer membrane protein assembly factor BamB
MDRLPHASPLLVSAFNAKVFAVDRTTGDIVWKFLLVRGDIVELAIDDQVVIACTTRTLVFLDYATGREIKYILRDDVAAGGTRPTMLVDDHHIYITGSGTVACYTTQGDLLWEQKFSGEGLGNAAIGFPGKVRQADDPGQR